jgi:hypothetical protein
MPATACSRVVTPGARRASASDTSGLASRFINSVMKQRSAVANSGGNGPGISQSGITI